MTGGGETTGQKAEHKEIANNSSRAANADKFDASLEEASLPPFVKFGFKFGRQMYENALDRFHRAKRP